MQTLEMDQSIGGQIDGMHDSVLDEIEMSEAENKTDNNKKNRPFTFINTNTRSLCPKIDSFLDCLEEMDSTIGVVTETWLSDGDSLQRDIEDLVHGAGVGLVCKNRPVNQVGVSHGGVTVVYRTDGCSAMQEIKLDNPDDFEVLATLATLPGY